MYIYGALIAIWAAWLITALIAVDITAFGNDIARVVLLGSMTAFAVGLSLMVLA